MEQAFSPYYLTIQQYLFLHPVVKKDLKIKSKYMILLKYFVSGVMSKNIWIKGMLQLYFSKLCVEDKECKIKDFNFFERIQFWNYKYFLLIDCLFIAAFNDKNTGKLLLANILDFFGNKCKKNFQLVFADFFLQASNCNDKLFSFPYLSPIFKVIRKNREFISLPEKRIFITANMSSGKSTLINALLGRKINKMRNVACTAKIHFIHNKSGEDGFIYELDHDLELNASLKILLEDNEKNSSNEIHVGARFRSIKEIDSKVCLIDSPGANYSMDQNHRKITNESIRSIGCNLLLYLLNARSMGTDDELRHLTFVRHNFSGNIIFLVNQLDEYKENEDSILETITSIKKDLIKLDFREPKVFPISAYAAYLAKMNLLNESLNEDELEDLELYKRKFSKDYYFFESFYPDKVSVSGDVNKELSNVLVHSGILSLEKIIFNLDGACCI